MLNKISGCLVTVLIFLAGIENAAIAQLTKLPSESVASKRLYPKDSVRRLSQAPANFPVPLYKSNVSSTTFSEATSTEGAYTAMVGIQTSDAIDVAYKWYQSQIQSSGWQLLNKPPSNISSNAQVLALRATRQNEKLMITCVRMPKFTETTIHVGVTVSTTISR
jgi:hypothetical protein